MAAPRSGRFRIALLFGLAVAVTFPGFARDAPAGDEVIDAYRRSNAVVVPSRRYKPMAATKSRRPRTSSA